SPAVAARSPGSRARIARYSGIAASASSYRRPSSGAACARSSASSTPSSGTAACGRSHVRESAMRSSPSTVTRPAPVSPPGAGLPPASSLRPHPAIARQVVRKIAAVAASRLARIRDRNLGHRRRRRQPLMCRATTGSPQNVSDWISNPTELAARLAEAPPRVGLDTEFVRERTWWPKLALVQVALEGGSVLLVDTLVPGLDAALAPLRVDPAVTKVMHSASEDLIAFKHACGVVPAPLFDTQIAAALAGVAGGAGYQRLVHDMLGVSLPKGETRSDWMRRPLSPAQLEYA